MIAQRWKHPIALEHCGSLRQFCVASQHFPTTHWLQGVPPGSRLQLPESAIGVPQRPFAQVSPMQHCAGLLQFEPFERQVAPQTLLRQTPVQQSAGCAQGKPSSAQAPPPQTPLAH